MKKTIYWTALFVSSPLWISIALSGGYLPGLWKELKEGSPK